MIEYSKLSSMIVDRRIGRVLRFNHPLTRRKLKWDNKKKRYVYRWCALSTHRQPGSRLFNKILRIKKYIRR